MIQARRRIVAMAAISILFLSCVACHVNTAVMVEPFCFGSSNKKPSHMNENGFYKRGTLKKESHHHALSRFDTYERTPRAPPVDSIMHKMRKCGYKAAPLHLRTMYNKACGNLLFLKAWLDWLENGTNQNKTLFEAFVHAHDPKYADNLLMMILSPKRQGKSFLARAIARYDAGLTGANVDCFMDPENLNECYHHVIDQRRGMFFVSLYESYGYQFMPEIAPKMRARDWFILDELPELQGEGTGNLLKQVKNFFKETIGRNQLNVCILNQYYVYVAGVQFVIEVIATNRTTYHTLAVVWAQSGPGLLQYVALIDFDAGGEPAELTKWYEEVNGRVKDDVGENAGKQGLDPDMDDVSKVVMAIKNMSPEEKAALGDTFTTEGALSAFMELRKDLKNIPRRGAIAKLALNRMRQEPDAPKPKAEKKDAPEQSSEPTKLAVQETDYEHFVRLLDSGNAMYANKKIIVDPDGMTNLTYNDIDPNLAAQMDLVSFENWDSNATISRSDFLNIIRRDMDEQDKHKTEDHSSSTIPSESGQQSSPPILMAVACDCIPPALPERNSAYSPNIPEIVRRNCKNQTSAEEYIDYVVKGMDLDVVSASYGVVDNRICQVKREITDALDQWIADDFEQVSRDNAEKQYKEICGDTWDVIRCEIGGPRRPDLNIDFRCKKHGTIVTYLYNCKTYLRDPNKDKASLGFYEPDFNAEINCTDKSYEGAAVLHSYYPTRFVKVLLRFNDRLTGETYPDSDTGWPAFKPPTIQFRRLKKRGRRTGTQS
jgi:hypothetical protein